MQKPIPTLNDPWVRWARLVGVLFVSATVLALFGSLVTGCTQKDTLLAPPQEQSTTGEVNRYVDPDTACQYLVVKGYGPSYSIAPRMDRDGKQVCK